MKTATLIIATLVFVTATSTQAQTSAVTRNGSQPSQRGPAEMFTRSVRIDPLFKWLEKVTDAQYSTRQRNEQR
jgi:hypothetical protein